MADTPFSKCAAKAVFHVAVRSMVEHVLRSGDLHFEFTAAAGAIEGIRAHQRLQRRRPADYQSEVPVALEVARPEFDLKIAGRIDGLFRRGERVVVEEIKTTRVPLPELEERVNPVHWGQAQCYAHLLARRENLRQVTVQLTYVHLESGRVLEKVREFTSEQLALFFEDLLARYLEWVQRLTQWARERDRSLEQLAFPYASYRAGQREMAVEVFRTIRDGGHLLVQAATGIGKTLAVLYPAIKALGLHHAPKVVFLTARTTGRLAAEAALQTLARKGMRLKRVSLTAKEKICFASPENCGAEECPFAKGYYDRLNEALAAAFKIDALTREAIEKVARDFRVCPFEFSLELVLWSDCVICDYNYAFDPRVTLRRLFSEEAPAPVLLVDEAHNLVERAREMFSAQLDHQTIASLRPHIKQELPRADRALGRVNTWMKAARKRCLEAGGRVIDPQAPQDLIKRLHTFALAAERWLRLNRQTTFRKGLLQLYFECLFFMRIAESYSPAYATVSEAREKYAAIKLFCLDPADPLRKCWANCGGAVLFSATLTPADYFQSALGCHADARTLGIPSPFPHDNLAVFADGRIDTFYRQRQNSCESLTAAIGDLVTQRCGHYLLFFPSYEYLALAFDCFQRRYGHIASIVQAPGMGDEQREAFLARFTEQVDHTLVGFAVMGGVFGEGIDLKGERLTGAVIVGVGLPGISPERELIRDYFERTRGCGFEFAYQYPGINRVLQAAGRVIRSETDRGVVLLIDPRYLQPRYRALLPAWWRLRAVKEPDRLHTDLAMFWGASAESGAPGNAQRGGCNRQRGAR